MHAIATGLNAKLQTVTAGSDEEHDLQRYRFYNAMLQCKCEAYKTNPDPDPISQALVVAHGARQKVTGPDEAVYDATIHFYEALVAYLRDDKQNAVFLYRACQEEMAKSCNPKFCLLQVPPALAKALAIFVGERMLDPDHTIKVAAKSATLRYYRYLITSCIVFTGACILILKAGLVAGYRDLAWFLVALVTTVILLRHKRNTEKRKLGLVSSSAIEWADRVVIAMSGILFFLLVETFRDFMS